MANEKLEKAKLSRKRWEAIYGVFKEITKKANLSREEMIDMCKKLPDFCEEHMEYMKTAPHPDYESFFTEIISLYISEG